MPVTITLQALSLVEMVVTVQVHHFTLRLRDQRSEFVNARWMSSLHGFLHGIKMEHVSWSLGLFSKTISQK